MQYLIILPLKNWGYLAESFVQNFSTSYKIIGMYLIIKKKLTFFVYCVSLSSLNFIIIKNAFYKILKQFFNKCLLKARNY